MCAIIGITIFPVPTFDVTSVKVPTNNKTIANSGIGCKFCKGNNDRPMCIARQDLLLAFEIANPPPRRNINLHGIFR